MFVGSLCEDVYFCCIVCVLEKKENNFEIMYKVLTLKVNMLHSNSPE